MSGSSKTKAEKFEDRAKILAVINTLDDFQTPNELALNPVLKGLSPKTISMNLQFMAKHRQVRRQDNNYGPKANGNGNGQHKASVPVAIPKKPKFEAFFVILAADRSLHLDFGGIRLPVVVE